MTQLSAIGAATPAAPRPEAAPRAPVADKPFAYVLHGLIGAQLSRSSSARPVSVPPVDGTPVEGTPARPAGLPAGEVTVGPNGPTTITAFRFWHRVLPIGADSVFVCPHVHDVPSTIPTGPPPVLQRAG